MSNCDIIKQNKEEKKIQLENTLEDYKNEYKKAKEENNERLIDFYAMKINNQLDRINILSNQIEYMRENTEEDKNERINILNNYAYLIKTTIPDYTPIVFHGVNNIGIVRDIIKSGGLFTCEQRGISDKSFATQIDVTYKTNIRVSLEFADPTFTSYMPYGAIIAFKPLDNELSKVYKTGSSSEVSGGVGPINFKEDIDRLYGIITTTENISRVQNWCLENKIDINKVFTHDKFLEYCNKLFNEVEPKHIR